MNTMRICNNISLNYSQKKKCFRQRLKRKSEHNVRLIKFCPENNAIYGIVSKNMVEPGSHNDNIKRICKATNTYSEYAIFFSFSTATMVERTRLNIKFYVHCLSGRPYSKIISYTSTKTTQRLISEDSKLS